MVVETDFIKRLRARIEERHKESLKALSVLHAYLEESDLPTVPKERKSRIVKHVSRRKTKHKRRSYRDKVLGTLNSNWLIVNEIAEATRLDAKRVRGVLYSPNRTELGIQMRRTKRGAEFRKEAEK